MWSCQSMFPDVTKMVVKTLGIHNKLYANTMIDDDWKMLRVVKVRKDWHKFSFKNQKSEAMEFTLGKLVDRDYTPVVKEKLLVEDFQRVNMCGGTASVKAGDDAVEGHLKANVDTVDTMSKISLHCEDVDMDDIFEELDNKEINKRYLKYLTLENHQKLAFVKQRIYNSGPVEVFSSATAGGSFSATILKWFSTVAEGKKTSVGSFKVPANKVFAIGLKDFEVKKGCLEISRVFRRIEKPGKFRCALLQCIKDDLLEDNSLRNKERNLMPLSDLPASTRCELMVKLVQIVEDRDVMSLLEDTLYQRIYGKNEKTKSELVNSFMDAMKSPYVAKAAHLLVYALDALPDDLPTLFLKCDPETLTVLDLLMDSVNEKGDFQPPEPLPLLLQEKGELHWVIQFVCTTKNLEEGQREWDCSDLSPEDLLEVLYISVKGLWLLKGGYSLKSISNLFF